MIFHVATEAVGSINVCEAWQTPQAAESFIESRLRHALVRQGVKDPLSYRLEPLHNLFAPDIDMIERIGATPSARAAHPRGHRIGSLGRPRGSGPVPTASSTVHFTAVFDALSDRLQATLGDLGRARRLDEDAVNKAMREIRLALLEADVNFQVVKDFVAGVKAEALGEDILKGLDAGQQIVKLVHDHLAELMGAGDSQLAFGRPPTVILMTGLQGSGKTTTSAKLALHLRRQGKQPGLVAADLQRPAAIDQLEQLGKQISIPVYRTDTRGPRSRRGRGPRAREGRRARRRHRRHGRPAQHRRRADGRARAACATPSSRSTSCSSSTR